jgi:hypothetical protein
MVSVLEDGWDHVVQLDAAEWGLLAERAAAPAGEFLAAHLEAWQ